MNLSACIDQKTLTLIEKCPAPEQWLETVRKLSPASVVVDIDELPPRKVTQPLGDEILAESVCPLLHERTSDRLSPGLTLPLKDVEKDPRANFKRVVAG